MIKVLIKSKNKIGFTNSAMIDEQNCTANVILENKTNLIKWPWGDIETIEKNIPEYELPLWL